LKTELTLGIIEEGKKQLFDCRLCIGAILLTNALKEQGIFKDSKVMWGTFRGYHELTGEKKWYGSFVNGEPKNLMDYENLLYLPITVEFREMETPNINH